MSLRQLPTELLVNVLDFAITLPTVKWSLSHPLSYSEHPHLAHCSPYLLVCREWNGVATWIIYRTVRLCCYRSVKSFLALVTAKEAVAQIVRHLFVETLMNDDLAALLRRLHRLKSLEITPSVALGTNKEDLMLSLEHVQPQTAYICRPIGLQRTYFHHPEVWDTIIPFIRGKWRSLVSIIFLYSLRIKSRLRFCYRLSVQNICGRYEYCSTRGSHFGCSSTPIRRFTMWNTI